ncbi:MAG: tetratricopeptide repeat protein [Candidatus Omnitrophica bacterium]|nr:tetratricopeptide repeat protein [Candidatus Omnitrophota bacterium]
MSLNGGVFLKSLKVCICILFCSLILTINAGCETMYRGPGYAVHNDKQAMDFAWVFYDQKNYDKAEQIAKVALQINSVNIDAYNLLGLIELKRGSLKESMDYLEKGKRIIVQNKMANGDYILCKLGIVYLKDGQLSQALDAFQQAIEIRSSWQAQLGVALALWELGETNKAIEAISRIDSFDATASNLEAFFNEFSLSKENFSGLIK